MSFFDDLWKAGAAAIVGILVASLLGYIFGFFAFLAVGIYLMSKR